MTHVVLVKLKGSVSKSHESQKRDHRKWGGGSRDGKEIREGVGRVINTLYLTRLINEKLGRSMASASPPCNESYRRQARDHRI